MLPSDAVRPAAALVRRFTRAERWVHHATAALFLVCVATAAALYLPPLAEIVGRRHLVVTVHEWAGLALPLPCLLGLASKAFRRDLERLNRFGPHDGDWLRARVLRRRAAADRERAGKFNAGQKLYAAFTGGTVLVMLGTGLVLWFPGLVPLLWRTGATFVHDWLAFAVAVAIAGHLWMAAKDPQARRGMRTGSVSREWARREHPLWEPGAASGTEAGAATQAGARRGAGPGSGPESGSAP
ncbi:cytochrome b/b6 domain-containing protein [Wenjunlia tyrosinilytica]|jgi:formate dehydrogenase subunit gamma|uniref:Formate dehydrogenase subunit gamma n=1 Tax=Wenjunlia tyrosinilytica TaxID=1544741 RepID=A0A917ZWF2_9ACTN|nr:cytochrome b/b6 domain-containing protein [Wenjunlia tyrosinilytica]GGO95827.1 formate dehydrogenase subunit gamma [Wenjunlia tyrosinilytica]